MSDCGCKGGGCAVDSRTRAARCHVCPWAEHDPVNAWVVGAVSCTVSGRACRDHALGVECPRGLLPSGPGGVVRWLGLTWYGLPMPLRLAFRLFHPRHPKGLPCCGCIAFLKDAWARVSGPRTPKN